MSWTPEQRRRYAPAISDAVRANATVRLAATIDVIDPPARTGRPRLWSTLTMLQALWWLCRAGAAWKLLPELLPAAADDRQPPGALGAAGRAGSRPGRAQRLPAPGARPQAAALGRHPRHPERADRAAGGPRGYDAGKKVKGSKRVLLVDTEGLVQAMRVVPASVQDRDTPAVIEPELAASAPAQGLGRSRLQRRARRSADDPPRHRARAGRAQEQDRASWSSRSGGRSSRPSAACPLPPAAGRS